jgi:hypothetical protein
LSRRFCGRQFHSIARRIGTGIFGKPERAFTTTVNAGFSVIGETPPRVRRIVVLARAFRIAAGLLCLGLCACHAARAAMPSPATRADIEYLAKITTAEGMTQTGECPGAVSELEPIASGPDYGRLSDPYRHKLDEALGLCAFRLKRARLAHAAFRRATASALADSEDWFWLLESAKLDADFGEVFAAFKVLRERAPGFEEALEDRSVAVIDQGLGTLASPEPQRAWEDYLEARGWDGHGNRGALEEVLLHHALNLLDQGKADHAARAAAGLTRSEVLEAAGADRRFDAIRARSPGHLDPAAAAQLRLRRFTELSRSDPGSLDWRSAMASELNDLGRSAEALSVVQKALAAAQQTPIAEQMRDPNWRASYQLALVQKSYLLFSLGRYEEALGVASGVGCGGCGPNTDAALLQARWLVALGRGQAAMDQLTPISNADLTLPARARLAELKVCALRRSGEPIRYLKAHRADDPRALVRAELCLGDQGAAAAAARSALEDERQRPLMLQELQLYLPDGVLTREQRLLAARLDALRARADVQAAVQRVGRIERLAVRKGELD